MLEQRYSIKPILSSKDRDYFSALQIYIKSIPADVRTDTNEISMFVDNPSDPCRKMYFFALLHQESVIGYAQFAWLKKSRILFLDYIVFDTNYRLNSAFYPFMSIIGLYFTNEKIDYDYFVTEIGTQNNGKSIDEDSMFLRKVLNVEDFSSIIAPYKQPELGINRKETLVDAQLYIKTSSSIRQLKVQTYCEIVHSIYYHHYLSWYEKILNKNEINEYRKMLDIEFKNIQNSLKKSAVVELTDCVSASCKYFDGLHCAAYGHTSASLPQIRKKRRKWPFSVLAIILTLICSLSFYYLLSYLNISFESFSGIYAATTTLAIGVTAYYFKERN